MARVDGDSVGQPKSHTGSALLSVCHNVRESEAACSCTSSRAGLPSSTARAPQPQRPFQTPWRICGSGPGSCRACGFQRQFWACPTSAEILAGDCRSHAAVCLQPVTPCHNVSGRLGPLPSQFLETEFNVPIQEECSHDPEANTETCIFTTRVHAYFSRGVGWSGSGSLRTCRRTRGHGGGARGTDGGRNG